METAEAGAQDVFVVLSMREGQWFMETLEEARQRQEVIRVS